MLEPRRLRGAGRRFFATREQVVPHHEFVPTFQAVRPLHLPYGGENPRLPGGYVGAARAVETRLGRVLDLAERNFKLSPEAHPNMKRSRARKGGSPWRALELEALPLDAGTRLDLFMRLYTFAGRNPIHG